MKPALLIAAVAALAAAPALAEAPPPPAAANYLDIAGLAQTALSGPHSQTGGRQCFSGRQIVGANRSGDTVYVQARSGSIWRLELAGPCAALDAAKSLRVRASGSDVVCPDSRAELIAGAGTSAPRCAISTVRRVTRQDVAALSSAPPAR